MYAAAGGEITKVYRDPLLGCAVEIAHSGNLKTVYCNLDAESVADLHEGQTVKSGACIGKVGDSSISECCDEPHLHFEMLVNGSSVNPLDYITAASQKASLGIEIEQA